MPTKNEYRKRSQIPQFKDDDEGAVRDALRSYFLWMIDTANKQFWALIAICGLLTFNLIFLVAIYLKGR